MKTLVPDCAALQAHFALLRSELASGLIERDEEIDLCLTALIAQEHLLLVSPPGCAKSLLLDSLLKATGGSKFSILLTKFTVPEEVFGPISIQGLKEDRFQRITNGKLPEADFAFLDEVFKASSAILNTLLKILNERTFDAGEGSLRKVPLKLCVAASNEWPAPESAQELAALFDRFTLRKSLSPIRSQAGRKKLLWNREHTPKVSVHLKPTDLEAARRYARELPWSVSAQEALETILKDLAKEGIQPGDRRQFKAVGIAQAYAFLHGAEQVEPEHLEVAAHVLWDDPREQPQKVAQVIARIANPIGMRLNQLLLEVEQVLSSTDVRKLPETAKAAAKLGEIDKQLSELKSNDRVTRTRNYVREQLRQLKLASLEAI
ncbi:AAA family ATPase [Telmatocola sphagniphila]|uniref:AAA family ATPase n=1 Tax=Telmatocola sphagniphila TaxID=1123043 RepID=A0A8E6EZU0_9BACT|nr:AAA family ATPase [Telmatocola sphagniphila]QVL33821.1 AAA family ATPase [Telmatocola sphagniphila]